LKQKANEKELKIKQEKKIAGLEQQIARYRIDCMNIMKYCNMQKQLLADYALRKRELVEDEDFLDNEVTQAKVDGFKLKINLTETHQNCEAHTFQNATAQEELQEILQTSMMASH